jgi:hypothetical protein
LELLQFVDSKVCMFLGSSCHQVGAWIHPDAPWASPSLPCFECSKAEQKDPMTDIISEIPMFGCHHLGGRSMKHWLCLTMWWFLSFWKK